MLVFRGTSVGSDLATLMSEDRDDPWGGTRDDPDPPEIVLWSADVGGAARLFITVRNNKHVLTAVELGLRGGRETTMGAGAIAEQLVGRYAIAPASEALEKLPRDVEEATMTLLRTRHVPKGGQVPLFGQAA